MSACRERRIIYWVGLGLLLAILPLYVYAWRAAGEEFVFGGFLFNPIDGNTYLAKMYQGWQGQWRYTLPYTARVEEGAHIFIFYTFLGHVARVLGVSLPLTFHSARLVSALIMVWALFRFFVSLEIEPRFRRLGVILAVFGSGLGWLGVIFGAFTSDLWVAEAYPFLAAYANPHFPLGLALLLWLLSPRYGEGNDKGWLSGIASLILAILFPFGVIIALVVLAATGIWELWDHTDRGKYWSGFNSPNVIRRFASVLIGGIPMLGYYFWVVNTNSAFSNWNSQNLTPSPPVWDFLLSFSPVILLAIPGGWSILKNGNMSQRKLLVWAALGVILSYLPLGLQRRFMMGLYVPLVGLAVVGLRYLVATNRMRFYTIVIFLIILAIPTNLVILISSFYGIQTRDPRLYLTQNEEEAMDWIAENTRPDSLILAAPETGLYIPAHTGRRVFYGHPFETANAENMERAVERFFMGTLEESDMDVIKEADYIYVGPREKVLGDCPCSDNMPTVYGNESVAVLRAEYAVRGFSLEW